MNCPMWHQVLFEIGRLGEASIERQLEVLDWCYRSTRQLKLWYRQTSPAVDPMKDEPVEKEAVLTAHPVFRSSLSLYRLLGSSPY